MNRLLAIALAFSCGTAHAVSPVVVQADPELRAEAAKHFGVGAVAYDEGHYAEAVGEFERAKSILPVPELDYNIAKALDRLGRWEAAVTSYRAYLATAPSNENEVVSRIAELEQRIRTSSVPQQIGTSTKLPEARLDLLSTLASPTVPSPSSRRRYLVPGLLGGGVVAVGAVGAGLLGSALWSYGGLNKACAPNCPASAWSGLPAREHAGEALLGIAGMAAVADVVLFVLEVRKGKK